MTTTLAPLKLWWRPQVPNPQKIVIILEELGLPYTGEFVELPDLYKPPFQPDVNPNGKVPALHDPNTKLTLWESGAIVQYLVDTYDTEGKISYQHGPEKFLSLCWQQLQATGQGPYFGQGAWFNMFHEEKLESAQKRYAKELNRILKVLDTHLADGKPYLVGEKPTFADLSFVSWNSMIPGFMSSRPQEEWDLSQYPHWQRWHDSLVARPSVKKAQTMQKQEDVHN